MPDKYRFVERGTPRQLENRLPVDQGLSFATIESIDLYIT